MSSMSLEREMAAAKRVLLYVTDQKSSKAITEYISELEGRKMMANQRHGHAPTFVIQ